MEEALLGRWLHADDIIADIVLRCQSGRCHDSGRRLPLLAAEKGGKAERETKSG